MMFKNKKEHNVNNVENSAINGEVKNKVILKKKENNKKSKLPKLEKK